MTESVRQHYESYPYPRRDPAEEADRLIIGSPSHLAEIDHYLFRGASDLSRPFRALVAGGGTGDATIMLAQQLADAGGPHEVIYLDLSANACQVAEARATARGLDNIAFLTAGILDIPNLGLQPFDYIDCCGVLHHLPDPLAGLRALRSVLKEDGGMGLMFYGALGRRGVYETQSMLKRIAGDLPLEDRVDAARHLLDNLPATNWLKRNPFLGDHKRSDAELADLLLHPQDRPFQVEEITDLVTAADLRVVTFVEAIRYEPDTYLRDPYLIKSVSALSPVDRAAFAEELAGNIKAHVLYVTARQEPSEAVPDAPHLIPYLKAYDGKALARACQRNLTLKVDFDGLPLTFALPRLAPLILERIDGEKSLGDILGDLQSLDSKLDWDGYIQQFSALFRVFRGINHLMLKDPQPRRK